MKNKKFFAMLMALAMMFSLCVGALADDPAPSTPSSDPQNGNTSFSGEAAVQMPTISVAVPETTKVFINPMGFKVTLTGAMATAADVEEDPDNVTDSKIVSPIVPILNNTPMKLSVGVIGSVTPKADNVALAIATAPITGDDTKNSVFVYALFGEPDYTPEVQADATATPPVEHADEKYSWKSNFTTTYSAETPATLALTTKAPTVPVVVGTIEAAKYTPASGDDPTAQGYEAAKTEPGRFAFQFLGDCNPNAKAAWNAGDSITVALAFTFKPDTSNNAGNAGNGGNTGG